MKLFVIYALFSVIFAQQAKILNDKNFEHDTQATSGHTTGDWFVLFCDKNMNRICEKPRQLWDKLYGVLSGRATAAYVDLDGASDLQ